MSSLLATHRVRNIAIGVVLAAAFAYGAGSATPAAVSAYLRDRESK
jgi:hypothetical protein